MNWSELARDPKMVAEIADADGGVRVIRRDGVNLILTREDRVQSAGAGAVIAARAMRQIALGDHDAAADAVSNAMVAEFPWLQQLPPDELVAFVRDFTQAMLAAAEINRWEIVDQLVTEWKHTAAIYAQPGLAERLGAPIEEDHGPVTSPGHGGAGDVQAW